MVFLSIPMSYHFNQLRVFEGLFINYQSGLKSNSPIKQFSLNAFFIKSATNKNA